MEAKRKITDTEENLKKCICMRCPSYNECMKEGRQGLFCARGKTNCDLKRHGCICNQCPISREYQFFGGYYCDIGAGWEEDVGKAVKVLAGTIFVPLKVAADIVGEITGSLESYIPKPSTLASNLIEMRISTLRTITKIIEKEIDLLEKYKGELEGKEEKKEKITVE